MRGTISVPYQCPIFGVERDFTLFTTAAAAAATTAAVAIRPHPTTTTTTTTTTTSSLGVTTHCGFVFTAL